MRLHLLLALMGSLSLILAPSPASAQSAEDPAAAELEADPPSAPGDAAEPTAEEAAPADDVDVAGEPTPATEEGEDGAEDAEAEDAEEEEVPAAATPALPFPIRATGTLHAMIILTNAVQTFAWPNASAITAAINPALLATPDQLDLSFQVQQTRVGLLVGEGTSFVGKLEVDFIHFDNSSPTVQAFPRLRIALLEWTPTPGHRLFLGQTWDIFSPLNTHTVNLVGNLFHAGNSGFMRHQLGWIGRFDALELAVVAGFQGANTGPSFNNIEQSFTPTGALRVAYHLGANGWFGASGIVSALRFTSGAMDERRLALGGNAFGDFTFGPVNLRAELYVAQNLANMGVLTLGQGRFGADVAEAGGWVSGKLTLGEHAVTAMFGTAAVFDATQVVPGYTPANPMAMPPTLAAPSAAAGPGLELNLTAHVGYLFSPFQGLTIALEPYVYFTRYRLAASDAALNPERVAFGAELGAMYTF